MKKNISTFHPKPLSEDDQLAWDQYVSRSIGYKSGPILVTYRRTVSKKLDLHNMTLQDAHKSTQNFLTEHWSAGTKSVTIVCGKKGTIVKELPTWCEISGFVRSISPIIDTRGEFGAYRIHLLKRDSNG